MKREIKKKVPASVVAAIKRVKRTYGGTSTLSVKADLSRTAIDMVVDTGKATPTTLAKIQKALKEAA